MVVSKKKFSAFKKKRKTLRCDIVKQDILAIVSTIKTRKLYEVFLNLLRLMEIMMTDCDKRISANTNDPLWCNFNQYVMLYRHDLLKERAALHDIFYSLQSQSSYINYESLFIMYSHLKAWITEYDSLIDLISNDGTELKMLFKCFLQHEEFINSYYAICIIEDAIQLLSLPFDTTFVKAFYTLVKEYNLDSHVEYNTDDIAKHFVLV